MLFLLLIFRQCRLTYLYVDTFSLYWPLNVWESLFGSISKHCRCMHARLYKHTYIHMYNWYCGILWTFIRTKQLQICNQFALQIYSKACTVNTINWWNILFCFGHSMQCIDGHSTITMLMPSPFSVPLGDWLVVS